MPARIEYFKSLNKYLKRQNEEKNDNNKAGIIQKINCIKSQLKPNLLKYAVKLK